ncbi:MAG: UbiA family prenyltransferase [Verrucomicrobia bacterium]|nr:UbiA family prenyltransferase [Verrucomicrobiota bacterium]
MLQRILKFIRFSHTVFALPFAVGSMLVAAKGFPSLVIIGLILLAMVFARTAAMAFNRIADWEMDKLNPRTAARHKLVSKATAYALVGFSSLAFFAVCSLINPICFLLSPVALVVIFFYSFTKRFTSYTQFFLGLSLAIAPVGAWLAVRGQFDWPPIVLALGVIFWVGGFDLIYATQDYDFDRKQGLHSMVVRFGVSTSLRLAQGMHAVLLLCLLGFGLVASLGWIYYLSLLAVGGALFYEHRAAANLDLAGINRAFFHSNAFVSVIFVLAVGMDVLLLGVRS